MTSLLTWLTGSRIGQYAACVVLFLSVAGIAATLIYRKGVKAEQANQTLKALSNALERINTDAKLEDLTPAQRRAILNVWMRGTL